MTDLERTARKLLRARDTLAAVMNEATDVAVAAHKAGTTEVEIARTLGVNRMTVRRWLGKL
jgi:predicted transcriptional regulator